MQYDDFINGEVHLNEVMWGLEEELKESRKRNLRILDAALKEPLVDVQVVLSICVQLSRRAFYNEMRLILEITVEQVGSQIGNPYSQSDLQAF